MEKQQLRDPQKEREIAAMAKLRANGGTVRDIAAQVGASKSSVSRALQTKQAKEIIERESQRLIESLPDITASSIRQIKTANRIHLAIAGEQDQEGEDINLPRVFETTKLDKEGNAVNVTDLAAAIKYAEVAGKRETDILKAVGILSSPVQSLTVQQIYNDNRQANLTPDVLRALSGLKQKQVDYEDAEIVGGDE